MASFVSKIHSYLSKKNLKLFNYSILKYLQLLQIQRKHEESKCKETKELIKKKHIKPKKGK